MTEVRRRKDPIKEQSKESKRAHSGAGVLFPRNPLKKALEVSTAIWKENGGTPFNILDLAGSLNMSPSSSSFVILLSSSLRHGLTEGSPRTKVISLTDLSRSIVAPIAETDVNAALRKALTTPHLFKQFFDRFDNKPIPQKDVLRNTFVNPASAGGFGVQHRM
jgi:hypothetical protein